MKFLPPGEAARALGLTVIALHRMIAYGEMPAIKRGNGVLVPVAESIVIWKRHQTSIAAAVHSLVPAIEPKESLAYHCDQRLH